MITQKSADTHCMAAIGMLPRSARKQPDASPWLLQENKKTGHVSVPRPIPAVEKYYFGVNSIRTTALASETAGSITSGL